MKEFKRNREILEGYFDDENCKRLMEFTGKIIGKEDADNANDRKEDNSTIQQAIISSVNKSFSNQHKELNGEYNNILF